MNSEAETEPEAKLMNLPAALTVKPHYLTVKEVAALLRKRERTIYELVAKGLIPFYRPPGTRHLLFVYDEIIDWVKSGAMNCD
jgi:excisionase family DNA binding protein